MSKCQIKLSKYQEEEDNFGKKIKIKREFKKKITTTNKKTKNIFYFDFNFYNS